MKQKLSRKIVLVGATVATVALIGCLGCAGQNQPAEEKGEAPAAPQEQASQPEAQAQDAQKPYEMKTLAEWVALYPNEGNTYMDSEMTNTYESFSGLCTSDFFGGEDAPNGCAACHAREHFAEGYAAEGEAYLFKNAGENAAYWSNCTNCHVGDPGDGKVEGGNLYGELTSASATKLFPAEDYICGQCHAMFPGNAYMEDAYKGIDQYKYGIDPEDMLRAMKEYYEANPLTGTEMTAGMVGVPMLDPSINTVLYMTDACTEVEVFQDSNHQKMGLTCIDCHMPQTQAADGAKFTNHNMTQTVLENPDALAKCMTCHKSQGIEDADAMVAFVQGKMAELEAAQAETKANLDAFHDALANVVANGGVDETKLKAAQDDYNLANVYFKYQAANGNMAAMNLTKCMDYLEKANSLIADGMAQLG
ncbi:ammonia-forming cytochrome c nitrite reductase subunit c552 [Adlercreutzia aquisgranensis]|uniref:ammonia-forming cytochrome c nitrite reductase subunit c552 n=1 Tax=Adlercreutzia aquisgranensis TaxID=2941323 RepID=UPI00203BD292|nr:ammonia-forming cytochrome c nitrite reductase subunit c552 [Adlercreutzia aquisgranensis]